MTRVKEYRVLVLDHGFMLEHSTTTETTKDVKYVEGHSTIEELIERLQEALSTEANQINLTAV
jgi:hypothetical protein